ncbi:TPA: hypothetical protein N0F65_012438, partial [Lagenidium giganteum]
VTLFIPLSVSCVESRAVGVGSIAPVPEPSQRNMKASPPPTPRVGADAPEKEKSLAFAGQVLLENVQQRVTIASIRSLFSCIGIGEETPFNLPPSHQMALRMKSNLFYFLTNYLLMAAAVFFLLLLFFHPIQLIVCIIVAWGWYIVVTRKHAGVDHLVVMGKKIGEQEILLFATASTIIFLVFFILPTIVFSISTSVVGSAAHALLRNNRLKDDSVAIYKTVPVNEAEDQV